MQRTLRAYLDPVTADRCFDALEGLDHDDLESIEEELGRHIPDQRALAMIMADYRQWTFERKLEQGGA
jgi:hypothetical protein